MRNLVGVLILTSSLAFITAVVAPQAAQQSHAASRTETTRLGILGDQLLRARLEHEGMENSMVSPASLFFALAILYEGAAGHTADLLEKILLKEKASDVLTEATMLKSVLQSPAVAEEAGFVLRNSVWASNGPESKRPFYFSTDFSRGVRQSFNADTMNLDFKQGGAAAQINEWVENATQGLVTEMFDGSSIKELSWLIVNAAYFNGAWARQFRREPPGPEFEFIDTAGATAQTPFIAGRQRSQVLDYPDGSIGVSIPFQGQRYMMVVYLPPPEDTNVASWITGAGIDQLRSVASELLSDNATVYDYHLRMPLFSYSDQISLEMESPLSHALSINPLFGDRTEYGPIVDKSRTAVEDQRTTLDFIQQDTRIELNEFGVRAAAVTTLGGRPVITRPPAELPQRDINADKPFLWAIIERESGVPVFCGALLSPPAH